MHNILNKEVTRKDFLKYAGFAFLAVTGISGILNNLGSVEKRVSGGSRGFGSGPYGG
jgi:hypothetical protein